MARKRPGYVAVRRIVAGMCIFVGLFVACFGLGNGRQAVMVAGLAIMVLATATRVATSFRRTPREWLQGTGRVVEVSEPPTDARLGRCSLQLVVEVPGMPEETVVVHDSRVPVSHWPQVGQGLPIQVAADDLRNVRVLWRDFTPVEMPAEAAWGSDQPVPAPFTPPGSHLDPSPVIDFDLDHPPTGPLRPMAPPERPTTEPVSAEPTSTEPAPAETSPGDEGRLDASTPLADEQRRTPVAPPPDEGQPGVTPSSEQARLATVAAAAAVPKPRPSPRPRRPVAATVGSGAAGTAATVLDDLVATYPSAHPGPAGAINGVGVTMLVGELDRSVAFYRDQLGFYEVDNGEGTSVLASGETRLVLRQTSNLGTVKQRLVHLNLEVSDIDAMYSELKGDGVRFTYPPRVVNETARLQLWAAAFRDPDGHGIALTQWRPAPDPPSRRSRSSSP